MAEAKKSTGGDGGTEGGIEAVRPLCANLQPANQRCGEQWRLFQSAKEKRKQLKKAKAMVVEIPIPPSQPEPLPVTAASWRRMKRRRMWRKRKKGRDRERVTCGRKCTRKPGCEREVYGPLDLTPTKGML